MIGLASVSIIHLIYQSYCTGRTFSCSRHSLNYHVRRRVSTGLPFSVIYTQLLCTFLTVHGIFKWNLLRSSLYFHSASSDTERWTHSRLLIPPVRTPFLGRRSKFHQSPSHHKNQLTMPFYMAFRSHWKNKIWASRYWLLGSIVKNWVFNNIILRIS